MLPIMPFALGDNFYGQPALTEKLDRPAQFLQSHIADLE